MLALARSRRGRPSRKGSALLVTLFTVAALLTLGTTFIALAVNEGRQSKGEKDAQLARQAAIGGINWAMGYMADPKHWSKPIGSVGTFVYGLGQPGSGAPEATRWFGQGWTFTTDSQANTWRMDMNNELQMGDMAAKVSVTIQGMVPGATSFQAGQPQNYLLTAVSHLYPYSASHSYPSSAEVASRTVQLRTRAKSAADFSIFESNMRTAILPGQQIDEVPPAPGTPGGTPLPAQPNTAGMTPAQAATAMANWQAQVNQIHNWYNTHLQAQTKLADDVGIPTNFTMNGDFRADGSTSGWTASGNSGDIHVYASTAAQASTIHFNGNTSFANGTSNIYDNAALNDSNSGIFTHSAGRTDMQGLPQTGLQQYVDPKDGTLKQGTYLDTVDANRNVTPGWAHSMANQDPDPNSGRVKGYVKVTTPAGGPVAAVAGQGTGADVEYDKTGANPQPGFAKTRVTFNGDGTVTVQKVGAYSGQPVPDTNPLLNTPVPISKLQNGLLYVDGGNVEVKAGPDPNHPGQLAKIDSRLTIVAGASTDRPTVTNTIDTNPNSATYGQPVAPQRINYPTAPDATSTSIYLDPLTKVNGAYVFANGNIPYTDSNGRAWFPAQDPSKVQTIGGDPFSNAALVREGNVSILSDITKGNNGSLGIVAQNYVLLSDQSTTKPATGSTLEVDAVLMSTQRSVQYGGFLNATANYWDGMAGVSIPRPAQQFSNSNFLLKGSIISRFADVEGTEPDASGVRHGYITQTFQQDKTLKDNLPPAFPQFDRSTNKTQPIVFEVLAWTDQGSLHVDQSQ